MKKERRFSEKRTGNHQIQVVAETVYMKGSLSNCVLSERDPEKPQLDPQAMGPREDRRDEEGAGGATETKAGEVSRKREIWQKGPERPGHLSNPGRRSEGSAEMVPV